MENRQLQEHLKSTSHTGVSSHDLVIDNDSVPAGVYLSNLLRRLHGLLKIDFEDLYVLVHNLTENIAMYIPPEYRYEVMNLVNGKRLSNKNISEDQTRMLMIN